MEFRQLREGIRAALLVPKDISWEIPLVLDEFALEVYGVSAEFNILTGDVTEMVKSLSGLVDHMQALDWDKDGDRLQAPFGSQYLLTFFGYYLLHQMCAGHSGADGDVVRLLMNVVALHPMVLDSPELHFVIDVRVALTHSNYHRFFQLKRVANPYQRSLMEAAVSRVRKAALAAMARAYLQFPLDELVEVLDLLSLTECLEFLKNEAGIPAGQINLKDHVVSFRSQKKK